MYHIGVDTHNINHILVVCDLHDCLYDREVIMKAMGKIGMDLSRTSKIRCRLCPVFFECTVTFDQLVKQNYITLHDKIYEYITSKKLLHLNV